VEEKGQPKSLGKKKREEKILSIVEENVNHLVGGKKNKKRGVCDQRTLCQDQGMEVTD